MKRVARFSRRQLETRLVCLLVSLLAQLSDDLLDWRITLTTQENFYTKEEMKVTWETRKILGVPEMAVRCAEGAFTNSAPAVAQCPVVA